MFQVLHWLCHGFSHRQLNTFSLRNLWASFEEFLWKGVEFVFKNGNDGFKSVEVFVYFVDFSLRHVTEGVQEL